MKHSFNHNDGKSKLFSTFFHLIFLFLPHFFFTPSYLLHTYLCSSHHFFLLSSFCLFLSLLPISTLCFFSWYSFLIVAWDDISLHIFVLILLEDISSLYVSPSFFYRCLPFGFFYSSLFTLDFCEIPPNSWLTGIAHHIFQTCSIRILLNLFFLTSFCQKQALLSSEASAATHPTTLAHFLYYHTPIHRHFQNLSRVSHALLFFSNQSCKSNGN